MTTCELTTDCSRRHASKSSFRSVHLRFLELLSNWHERARQRRELGEVPEYLLKDMGITAEDLHREVRKPFWQA